MDGLIGICQLKVANLYTELDKRGEKFAKAKKIAGRLKKQYRDLCDQGRRREEDVDHAISKINDLLDQLEKELTDAVQKDIRVSGGANGLTSEIEEVCNLSNQLIRKKKSLTKSGN